MSNEDSQIEMDKFDSPEYFVGDKKFRATFQVYGGSTIVVD